LKKIDPDAEMAVVKEGIDNYACISLSAEAARRLIHERAAAAMAKIGTIRPYRVNGPVTIEMEYTSRHALTPDAALKPGAEVVNARTIRFHGKDFLEAWERARP
jgi:D-amino peptidase